MKGAIHTIVRDLHGELVHRSVVDVDDVDAAIADHAARHGIDLEAEPTETRRDLDEPPADPAPKRKRARAKGKKRR